MRKKITPRNSRIAFIALAVVAHVPMLTNAIVATPPHLSPIIVAQGITLFTVMLALLRPRAVFIVYGTLLALVFPLDAVSIIGTNSPSSYGIANAFLSTTAAETLPQIKANLPAIAAFLTVTAIYFVAVFHYIPWRFRLPKAHATVAPLAALCGTLTITLLAATPYARQTEQRRHTAAQSLTDRAFALLFPARDISIIADIIIDRREIASSLAARNCFPDTLFTAMPGFCNDVIGILSIGETARACRWQLAGFERATTPRLAKRKNLFFFADTYSGANLTEFAAPMLFSNDTPQKIRTWETSPILHEIFNPMGITTAQVSSQGKREKWRANSFLLLTASSAKNRLMSSSGVEPYVPDAQLLKPTAEVIAGSTAPLFITFWGYGGHHEYIDRYQREDEVFTPANKKNKENELNAFDNTTIHTDRVHDSLISLLEASGKPAFLIYAADHGESLYDLDGQNHYHGTQYFCHGEAHVPCFIWLSEAYINRYPKIAKALVSNLAKPVQTSAIFHTAQHLMHAVGPDFDSTSSLASRTYAAPKLRMGLNANRELLPPPPYDSTERLRIDSAICEQLRRHMHLIH